MAPGHTTGYHRVEGLGVGGQPSSDTGEVGATGGTEYTNVLGLGGEGKSCSIHHDRADFLPVVGRVVAFRVEEKQLRLLPHIDHASGCSEGLGQVEQGLQGMGSGDRRATSSATPMDPTLVSPILRPRPALLVTTTSSLLTSWNWSPEDTPPCSTPLWSCIGPMRVEENWRKVRLVASLLAM